MYDPFDELATREHTLLLEGLANRRVDNKNVAFGRLNIRQHAMLRDEYWKVRTGEEANSEEDPFWMDYYQQVMDNPNDVITMNNETLLNFQLGRPYWPARLNLVAHNFNVYGQVDLTTILGSIPIKVAVVNRYFDEVMANDYLESVDPLIETESNVEKEMMTYRKNKDNSFNFKRYERVQKEKEKTHAKEERKNAKIDAATGNAEINDDDEEEPLQKKMATMRLLLETDSKDDGKASNYHYFIYKKAKVKKIKETPSYLSTLGTIIEEYLAWAEGYETVWSPERKAREDEQCNFGFYLNQMNLKLQQLLVTILDENNPTYKDPNLLEQMRINPEIALRMDVPPLQEYYEELVFGSGRSVQSFRAALAEIANTMGETAEARRQNRAKFNGTEFALINRLRDYLNVNAMVDEEPKRYSMIMGELVTDWHNIMRDFHANLNKHYTKYLQEHPLPHGNQFQFKPMDVLDMKDPANFDMLSSYYDFHKKYTSTGTPVILSNVEMTINQTLTLDSIVEQCATSDVTRSVHVSNRVGERQAGNGWGGLKTYVLDDALLNNKRMKAKKKSMKNKRRKNWLKLKKRTKNEDEYEIVTDEHQDNEEEDEDEEEEEEDSDDEPDEESDEDSDDEPRDGVDRSLTMEQFSILSRRIDTLYLHDYSLPGHCDLLLYNETIYDQKQKFQIPSVIASYDLFQRLPLSSYADSWPSLFVGKKGSNSKLHIDSGATGFFMYLIEGRKRWMVYSRDERVHLYERIDDYSVYPDVLGMGKDDLSDEFLTRRFPLLHRAESAYEIIQEPGQLVYIPPGCPHAVENLDDIIGLAMNMVPLDGVANHFQEQIQNKAEFGNFDMAMDYLLFEDNADKPVATQDPLYTTFGEYKAQY